MKRSTLTRVAAFAAGFSLSACREPPTVPTTLTPGFAAPTLTGLSISGLPPGRLVVGQIVHLQALARFSDNTTRNVTLSSTWASSAPNALAVSTGGIITGLAAGDASVSVTYQGINAGGPLSVIDPAGSGSEFRVAILLAAANTQSVSDVTRVFDKANQLLMSLTGERMIQVDLATVGPGVPIDLARTYMSSLPGPQPDGVLALSDDATATSFGGYSTTFVMPPPYANRYPNSAGASRAYLAVVHFEHKYARCGYNFETGPRVSDRSIGGECRGQPGLICVDNGRYWQCPDSLSDLYSEPDRFVASSIVHEFMHPFGSAGDRDHFGTPECVARTGQPGSDRLISQQHCGMCPDLFLKFRPR